MHSPPPPPNSIGHYLVGHIFLLGIHNGAGRVQHHSGTQIHEALGGSATPDSEMYVVLSYEALE